MRRSPRPPSTGRVRSGAAIATVLAIVFPERAFLLMVSVSMFGSMFGWGMIFLTHLYFRRRNGPPEGFRLWLYPYTTIAGLVLMIAVLVTTWFTEEFHTTLIFGVPFLLTLVAGYFILQRRRAGQPA